MIDTITIVFQEELDVLKQQARSLDLYVKNIDTVFVVINQDKDLAQQIDPAWWGQHQNRVCIVPRNRFGHKWSHDGWVSQQVLKLMANTICQQDWAVILDAKTLFVRPLAELLPRPTVGQLGIHPVFNPSRDIANALFDIDVKKQLGPGGVPFVINRALTCEMISWIETQTRRPFADWFQAHGLLTEFILYSAWIQFRTGSLGHVYNVDVNNIVPCNLCHSEVAQFEKKLAAMHKATTVSIHRNAWNQLTCDQKKKYTDFLQSRGIL